MNVTAVQVIIEGRVQGVWFRGWMKQEARARDLRGWVRNRRDGSVEAVIAGRPEVVDDMVALCWHGPLAANVSSVVARPAPDQGYVGFTHLPTT